MPRPRYLVITPTRCEASVAQGGISIRISAEEIAPRSAADSLGIDEIASKGIGASLWGQSPPWMRSHLGRAPTQAEVGVKAEAGVKAYKEAEAGRWGVKLADVERSSPRSVEQEPEACVEQEPEVEPEVRMEAYPVEAYYPVDAYPVHASIGNLAFNAAVAVAGAVAGAVAEDGAPGKVFRSYDNALPGVKEACRKIEP